MSLNKTLEFILIVIYALGAAGITLSCVGSQIPNPLLIVVGCLIFGGSMRLTDKIKDVCNSSN